MFCFIEAIEISEKVCLRDVSQKLIVDHLTFVRMEPKVSVIVVKTSMERWFFSEIVTIFKEGFTWDFYALHDELCTSRESGNFLATAQFWI